MGRSDFAPAGCALAGGIALACLARGVYPLARARGFLLGGVVAGACVLARVLAFTTRRRASPPSWYGPAGPPRGSYWRPHLSWRPALAPAAIALAAAALGFGRTWQTLGPPPPDLAALTAAFRPLPGGRVLLRGTVASPPEATQRGMRLYVRPQGAHGPGGLICLTLTAGRDPVVGSQDLSGLQRGGRVAVAVRLSRPTAANPGEETFVRITPQGWVWGYAWATPGSPITLSPAVRVPSRGWLWRVADRWGEYVQRARASAALVLTRRNAGEAAAIARALILGERGNLTEAVEEDFARAGAVHLLVVSGLHLSVVAALAAAMARGAGGGRTAQAAAAALAILAYGSLTGWTAPVTRAALMSLSAQVGRLLGRRANPERSLGLAVCLMLLHRPLLFLDAGFRLSAAATWGVVALAPALEEWAAPHGLSPRGMLGRGLSAALGAQAATIPLSLQYFGRVPCVALIGSPVLVAVADALVEAGVLVLALGGAFPVLAGPLSAGFGAGALLLWQLARLVGRLPVATLNLPAWPGAAVVAYYFLLWQASRAGGLGRNFVAAGLVSTVRARPRLGAALVAVALGLLVWSGRSPHLALTFLSVGQGDALHLRLPGGLTAPNLLIDAGPSSGRTVGYLRRQTIQRLATVIITHPHRDHRGGLAGVRAAFPVNRLIEGEGAGWRLHTLSGVDLWLTGSPPGEPANEASRRTLLRYGRLCLVSTGDAPLAAAEPLLANLPRRGTPKGDALVIVVKVPHHGAKGVIDPEFLRLYRPDLAVIQVGPNAYGHPDPGLVRLLAQYGARVVRTDQEGAVRIETDGRRVRLRTYPPQEASPAPAVLAVTGGT